MPALTIADFLPAFQHADSQLSNSALHGFQPEIDSLGQPVARRGMFAIVFKLTAGKAVKAARVCTGPFPEQSARYAAIQTHLRGERTRWLVAFDYAEQGLRLRDEWFPLQLMPWIDGPTLDVWIADQVRRQDSHSIRRLADRWVELSTDLRASQVAHGDLCAQNILISGDDPVLVDYDTLCVPQLVGQPAFETGHPAFQHPHQAGKPLSLAQSDFPAWLILVALRAIAADPGLWHRHAAEAGAGSLLFAHDDLKQTSRSKLWAELLASRDAEVREWAARLRQALDRPADQVPPFEVDVYKNLRAAAPVMDWDAIGKLADELERAGRIFPPELAPRVQEARRRIACRDRLRKAVNSGAVHEIAAAYDPSLVDDWPACRELMRHAREAQLLAQALDELDAAQQRGDGRRLVALWEQYALLVQSLPETHSLAQEVHVWKRRLDALNHLENVLAGNPSEQAIVWAWRRLDSAGGHPDAQRLAARAQLASRRVACLGNLKEIPANLPLAVHDAMWLRTWDEQLLADCLEAQPLRARYEEARRRARWREELKRVLSVGEHFLSRYQEFLTPEGVRDSQEALQMGNKALADDDGVAGQASQKAITQAVSASGTASILFLAQRAEARAAPPLAQELGRTSALLEKAHRERHDAQVRQYADVLKELVHKVLEAQKVEHRDSDAGSINPDAGSVSRRSERQHAPGVGGPGSHQGDQSANDASRPPPAAPEVRRADAYRFSVFYPERADSRAVGKVLAFGHLDRVAKDVVREAAQRLELPVGTRLKASTAEAALPLPPESTLKVAPCVPGLKFSPGHAEMALWADQQSVEFRFRPEPGSVNRSCTGWVQFTLEGLLVAAVPLTIFVAAEEVPDLFREALTEATARPYRTVFPSYSHDDKEIVTRLETYAAAFGDEYLRDVHKLRAGQRWNKELLDFIRRADVFQLFWSTQAAASRYVEEEWRSALRERLERPDTHFIRPVYWTEQPAPIPPELNELHFARLPL